MNTAELRIQFATPVLAAAAGKALEPDHDGTITWKLDGATLHLMASANTTLGLVRTLDDVLGCIRAMGVA